MKKEKKVVKKKPVINKLQFLTPIFCYELDREYKEGIYQPESLEEYNALKSYAIEVR